MTDIKDILHTVSDQSDAEALNLWYAIEADLEEQNLMKKKKGTPRRLNFGLIAALIGVIVLGSIAYGMALAPKNYHLMTLEDIRAMATVIDESREGEEMTVTVDWAYADPTQIVLAYRMTDNKGNPIPMEAVDDGFVELHMLWRDETGSGGGEYSAIYASPRWNLAGESQDAETTTGQQIARFNGTLFHFEMIRRLSESQVNLNERTTLSMRAIIETASDSDSTSTIPFEVPYDVLLYQGLNGFVNYDPFDPVDIPADEFEVYVDHIVVAESGIAAVICYHFPEDRPSGNYFSSSLQLYVDGRLVETERHDMSFNTLTYTSSDKVELHTRAWFPVTDYHLSCSDFVWNIGFEELPDEIRIGLSELNYSSAPVAFDNLEQLQLYADLFQAEGYEIDVSLDESYLMDSGIYPTEYRQLDIYERYAVQMRVLEQFYETYPPETQYTGDWSYTFNLSDS